MIAAMIGPIRNGHSPLSRMNWKSCLKTPHRTAEPGQVIIPNPGHGDHLRDHAPSIEAPDIGEAEHQIERLIARQSGLHVAQYEHRKHDTGDRGGDDAIAHISRQRRCAMDQAQSNPTKTLSSTPTAWVTIAAAIALAAAMTRNGRGGAQRSMHNAHAVSTTSAAISSWSF